ncbi:hypothetical protein D4R78_07375 [bacterium]|nr:MAG: hypothetical protein D4R78_07375 [bacterium]
MPKGFGKRNNLSKFTQLVSGIAVLLISTVALILTLEGLVRILMPEINFVGESNYLIIENKYGKTFGYKPNVRGVSWGAELYTDNYGFRFDPQGAYQHKKDQSLPSVVILGDSVALGIGVPAKDAFVNLISQQVRGYNFYNASVIMYGVSHYKDVVEQFVIPNQRNLNIKEVFLFYTLNDINNLVPLKGQEFIRQKSGFPEYKNIAGFVKKLTKIYDFNPFLVSHSKLYLLLKKIFYDCSKTWFFYDYQEYRNAQRLRNLGDTMRYIKDALSHEKIELTILVLPYEFQLRENNRQYLLPQEVISAELNKIGVKNYDLYPAVYRLMKEKGFSSRDLFLFNDHCHPSVKGNAIIAQVVLKILDSQTNIK